MYKTFWQILSATIAVASLFFAIIDRFNKPDLYVRIKNEQRKKHTSYFIADIVACFIVYKKKMISTTLTIVSSVVFALLTTLLPDQPSNIQIQSTQTIAPALTPSPTPAIEIAPEDAWLDEVDPLLPRKDAFYRDRWNPFDSIVIDDVAYSHGIGVRIPQDDQLDYYKSNPPEQQTHSEYIEYPLSYKYKTLQFDYGIDDSSFPDDVECAPQCEFKIVVQSCKSDDYLESDEDILYQTQWLNYRRTLHRSDPIDVSSAETCRITVLWRFYVHQEKPLALNVAIVNPILYAVKS